MSRASRAKRQASRKSENHKALVDLVGKVAYRHEPWRVFSDFCEMAALSLAQPLAWSDAREERYLSIARRYAADEINLFPRMLAHTVAALDTPEPSDFLGEVFEALELANHWHGQFFTPMSVARMMAEMTLQDVEEIIRERGYFTLLEPACGAGAMVIAAAASLRARGIDYQQCMHATAIDIDATAAHMTFIQLSLLHVPAVVHVGNALSWEIRDTLLTPAHHLGFWSHRLSREAQRAPATAEIQHVTFEPKIPDPQAGRPRQLSLFDAAP